MSLYHKYRPAELEALRGNADTVEAIGKMLTDLDSCPHAFLFHGPTGTGKTTLARIIATRLECNEADINELDTADFRGIDTVRELRRSSNYLPTQSQRRMWILDECHKMTNDAQNALLKILEEPPPFVYFALCTTEPNKLISTIRGRCSQFQMQLLSDRDMMKLLREVTSAEGESLPKSVYEQIIFNSLGHPRNALQILEQVLLSDPDRRLDTANKAAEQQNESIELCRALIKGQSWKIIATILTGLKTQDAESIRRVVLGYCQSVLLRESNPIAGLILEEFIEPFYNSGFPGLVYACYSVKHNS